MAKNRRLQGDGERLAERGEQEVPDEMNPELVFNGTHTHLLLWMLVGDPKNLIKDQLAKRGVDDSGSFIGFEEAEKFWATK